MLQLIFLLCTVWIVRLNAGYLGYYGALPARYVDRHGHDYGRRAEYHGFGGHYGHGDHHFAKNHGYSHGGRYYNGHHSLASQALLRKGYGKDHRHKQYKSYSLKYTKPAYRVESYYHDERQGSGYGHGLETKKHLEHAHHVEHLHNRHQKGYVGHRHAGYNHEDYGHMGRSHRRNLYNKDGFRYGSRGYNGYGYFY